MINDRHKLQITLADKICQKREYTA